MRTWTWREWTASGVKIADVPVGDRIIDPLGVVFERRPVRGTLDRTFWHKIANRIEDVPEPLDEYDFAFLRSTFGLSEDVEL